MTIEPHEGALAVLALVLLAHAWSSKIIGNPFVLSVIGWVVNGLAVIALASLWVRC
jgi:hypothetical protein